MTQSISENENGAGLATDAVNISDTSSVSGSEVVDRLRAELNDHAGIIALKDRTIMAGHLIVEHESRVGQWDWSALVALARTQVDEVRRQQGLGAAATSPQVVQSNTVWPEEKWNQVGNARRTLRMTAGRLVWVPEEGAWFECDEHEVWRRTPAAVRDDVAAKWCARAMEAAVALEATQYDDAPTKKQTARGETADKSKREKFMAFMDDSSKVEMHTSVATQLRRRADDFGISISLATFDANPHEFAAANGLIDLQTGEIRTLRRDDYVSMASPFEYDPAAKAPLWERFISSAFPDSTEARAMQLALGYSIVGGNKEQVGFIHHGVSGSGRSTMFKVLAAVMGEHFGAANSRSILQARRGGTPQIGQDMLDLRGRRFLSLSETAEGAHLDNEAFKSITAGDIRSDRPHAKANVQYRIDGVIHVATNHLPHITPDKAIGRRLVVVPWMISHTDHKDVDLEAKLLSEGAGVLTWLVRGAMEVQAAGLLANIPQAWTEAANEHMLEEDEVAQWLDERTIPTANTSQIGPDWTASAVLYSDYATWCFGRRSDPMAINAFGRRLREKGFDQKKPQGGARQRPLTLKDMAYAGLREMAS